MSKANTKVKIMRHVLRTATAEEINNGVLSKIVKEMGGQVIMFEEVAAEKLPNYAILDGGAAC